MVSNFVKKIICIIPFDLEGIIRSNLNRLKRNNIIKEWKKNGSLLPPPHAVKQQVIGDYKNRFKYKVLIETGTYKGHMIYAQLHNFDEIYSVELDINFYLSAKDKFKKYKYVHLSQGDSGKCLGQIIANLKVPAIFWLDGHYMGNDGVKGDSDCPIWGELEAIFSGPSLAHVILIDDARSFTGLGDYPSIDSLNTWIQSKNSQYKYVVENDIIQFFI